MSEEELENHTKECDAIVSTLGHNLSFKGCLGIQDNLLLILLRTV